VSWTRSCGCLPIPRREGIRFDPGRERDKERNREAGALEVGVIEKRFDAHAAPSGVLLVTGGMVSAMIELSGRARPRIPLKLEERGSSITLVAAAKEQGVSNVSGKKGNWCT